MRDESTDDAAVEGAGGLAEEPAADPADDATTDAGGAGEGTYTLVAALATPATIEVGALGPVAFEAGWYAYTGSAFGPGGFARIDRHRELAAGERDARHWHVDHLLGHPEATLETAVRTPGADVECAVAGAIEGRRVPEFGASDCDCESHLVYGERRDDLLWSVERAHDSVGGG